MRLRLLMVMTALGALVLVGQGSGHEWMEVLESNDQRTLIRIEIPELLVEEVEIEGSSYQILKMEGAAYTLETGRPKLPFAGTSVAIPPLSAVNVRLVDQQYSQVEVKTLYPHQAEPGEFFLDEGAYLLDSYSPVDVFDLGEPAILRDYRILPLRVYPVSYNPVAGTARVLRSAVIELTYEGVSSVNTLSRPPRSSPSFEDLYRQLIVNYEFLPQPPAPLDRDEGARYLIITHDNFYDAILPLAEWKHLKGMMAMVTRLSEIGSSSGQIKAYIQDAYDTWEVPPEFVLLVGDSDYLPTYGGSDNYYAQLVGADIFADIYVGRFSVDNVSQCNTMVSKTLGYERTPYTADPDWFKSACLVVRDDYDSSDETYYDNTFYAYGLMQTRGFVEIDTLFRKDGRDADDVEASVMAGRTFVSYRGQGISNWWSPFEVQPDQCNNGFKLPMVVSATCGTGSFSGTDGYVCEDWIRAGTAENPEGAVAFFGTSTVCSNCSELRGSTYEGFYQAALQYIYSTFGECANHARTSMWLLHQDNNEYEGWNMLGDPELNYWIGTPVVPEVIHDPVVAIGPGDFEVTVNLGGLPAKKVWVCVSMDSTVYEYAQTLPSGDVTFSISPVNLDTLWITVTSGKSDEVLPYEGYAVVITAGAFVAHDSSYIDDSVGGNGDGLVNPGETIDLWVALANDGADTAYQVTGTLRTQEMYVTLEDSLHLYGDIPPESTVASSVPYVFHVSEGCPNLDSLDFSLFIEDTSGGQWTSVLPTLVCHRAELVYVDYTIDDSPPGGDGDGKLEGGESAYLVVSLTNDGLGGLTDVDGSISTQDQYLEIIDSLGDFGNISGGGGGDNSADPFYVASDTNAPHGYYADVALSLSGDGSTYAYVDTIDFLLGIAPVESTDPTGPDAYGYYAYDDTDILWGHAPTYEWFEIAPPGPGSIISDITNQDAATTTLSLPFTFRYYDADYTQLSVCSNGFLAMGVTSYRFGDNSSIPNTHGPDAMISPFWDDLDPSAAGDIYEYYDESNHRFIVEFDDVAHNGASGQRETFQAVFYDPAYYPTPTGDGEIVFFYNYVANITENTVGIENLYQTDGIQYLFDGAHDTTSTPPAAGRAIKFTTFEPGSFMDPAITIQTFSVDDSEGGNGDGLVDAGERIEMSITLVNDGDLDGNSVVGTLTSSDPDVGVTDGVANFTDLAAGGGTGDNDSNPFVFEVVPSPADDSIYFQLAISANGGTYETIDSLAVHIASLIPRSPALTIDSHVSSDSVGGNGDGIPDAGEFVEIWFTLVNDGDLDADGVEGVLRCVDLDAAVIDSLAPFGDLASGGGTGSQTTPYLCLVDSSPSDTLVQFELHLVANDARYDTIVDFALVLGETIPPAPNVDIVSYSIIDTIVGNGDAVPDPGETVEMVVYLENDGNLDAEGVSGVLISADPDATMIDTTGVFGDMPGWGSSGNNDETPYLFEIAAEPEDTLLEFSIEISANGETYAAVRELSIGIGTIPFMQFRRGDVNADNGINTSDIVPLLQYLYLPGSEPPLCRDAADADDDGGLDMGDVTYLLKHLYVPGSPEPPLPYPGCGPDPTEDTLSCGSHPCTGLATIQSAIQNRGR